MKPFDTMVVGDLSLERTTHGHVRGVARERGNSLILRKQTETTHLGGAAYVAATLANLGNRSLIFGTLGADFDAEHLLRLLETADVAYHVAQHTSRLTSVRHIFQTTAGQCLRLDTPRQAAYFTVEGEDMEADGMLRQLAAGVMGENPPVVIVYDRDQGLLRRRGLQRVMSILQEHHAVTIVDPGRSGRLWNYESPGTVLRLNLKQALAYLQARSHAAVLPEHLPGFWKRHGLSHNSTLCAPELYLDFTRVLLYCLAEDGVAYAFLCLSLDEGGATVAESGKSEEGEDEHLIHIPAHRWLYCGTPTNIDGAFTAVLGWYLSRNNFSWATMVAAARLAVVGATEMSHPVTPLWLTQESLTNAARVAHGMAAC